MPSGLICTWIPLTESKSPVGVVVQDWLVIAALAGLSFRWTDWLLWLALVLVFGRQQDMPLDGLTELTVGQHVFAAAMLLVFVLVFVPVPRVAVPECFFGGYHHHVITIT